RAVGALDLPRQLVAAHVANLLVADECVVDTVHRFPAHDLGISSRLPRDSGARPRERRVITASRRRGWMRVARENAERGEAERVHRTSHGTLPSLSAVAVPVHPGAGGTLRAGIIHAARHC